MREQDIYLVDIIQRWLKHWKGVIAVVVILVCLTSIYGYSTYEAVEIEDSVQLNKAEIVLGSPFMRIICVAQDNSLTMDDIFAIYYSEQVIEQLIENENLDTTYRKIYYKLRATKESDVVALLQVSSDDESIDEEACLVAWNQIGSATVQEYYPNVEIQTLDEVNFFEAEDVATDDKKSVNEEAMKRGIEFGLLGVLLGVFLTFITNVFMCYYEMVGEQNEN